jgi:hypothetical protein
MLSGGEWPVKIRRHPIVREALIKDAVDGIPVKLLRPGDLSVERSFVVRQTADQLQQRFTNVALTFRDLLGSSDCVDRLVALGQEGLCALVHPFQEALIRRLGGE